MFLLNALVVPTLGLSGCMVKCDYTRDMCVVNQCSDTDLACQDSCGANWQQCTNVCKGRENACGQTLTLCRSRCEKISGSRDTCNNTCAVEFQCCSLPSLSEEEEQKDQLKEGAEKEQGVVPVADMLQVGSLTAEMFASNLCQNSCVETWNRCRSGCMFNEEQQDVCARGCDEKKTQCTETCAVHDRSCNNTRQSCEHGCPGNGAYSESCLHLCQTRAQCCQLSGMRKNQGPSMNHQHPELPANAVTAKPEDAIQDPTQPSEQLSQADALHPLTSRLGQPVAPAKAKNRVRKASPNKPNTMEGQNVAEKNYPKEAKFSKSEHHSEVDQYVGERPSTEASPPCEGKNCRTNTTNTSQAAGKEKIANEPNEYLKAKLVSDAEPKLSKWSILLKRETKTDDQPILVKVDQAGETQVVAQDARADAIVM